MWDPHGDLPAGDPPGRTATVRLAVPHGPAVGVRPVTGREVDLDTGWSWLATLPAEGPGLSASVHGWARLAQGLDPPDVARQLPPAGHCEPRPAEDGIRAAQVVIDDLLHTRTIGHDLARSKFRGRLRDYQLAGVAWLAKVDPGGLLADEMGLGKTVQALALMALRPDQPHLVLCPASLVANWAAETARHVPTLPVLGWQDDPAPGTLTVMSFTRLRLHPDAARRTRWGVVVLDEAQQLKSTRTLAHQAAATLHADTTIALTGTPVENTLDDLWALAQLAHPGTLGTRRQFRDRIAGPLQRRASPTAAARLAERTDGLLLRRTKTDVAAELPPRQTIDLPCSLTREQRHLYRLALGEAFADGLGRGGRRRAVILALLTRLKQICNHPAQALHQDGPLPRRSGKFDQLSTMLDQAHHTGTGVLVFTQYTAMGRLITDHLHRHDQPAPFLHGGLSLPRRARIVEHFQAGHGGSVLVISLKAAGVGLTLTRATTVIHYDRWWNPAVEDQASDRAHRIGQDLPVTIYTLRAAGTVEDHIAALHDHKRALATALGPEPTAALTALPDEQLRHVLELDADRLL